MQPSSVSFVAVVALALLAMVWTLHSTQTVCMPSALSSPLLEASRSSLPAVASTTPPAPATISQDLEERLVEASSDETEVVTPLTGRLNEGWSADVRDWAEREADVVVVGAGLSGAVLAERLAERLKLKVLVIEKRRHTAGNCFDFMAKDSGVLMNRYGAHLFHTTKEYVWKYVNRFCEWKRWEHEVVGMVDGRLVPIPVNPTTVNVLLNMSLASEKDMMDWLSANKLNLEGRAAANSEETAKSRVGAVLYEKIFLPYTLKQWERHPSALAPEVLGRIPVHHGFDTRYFTDRYQALPAKGYTYLIDSMLNHSNIRVAVNVNYFDVRVQLEAGPKKKILIFTGPIDSFFNASGLAPLQYRSLRFEHVVRRNVQFFQPKSVVNYPEANVPFTRIVEHKHFLNQQSNHTVYSREYPSAVGEPYYPIPTAANQALYERYRELAKGSPQVHFVGRLASYKYFNMDAAIENALQYFANHFEPKSDGHVKSKAFTKKTNGSGTISLQTLRRNGKCVEANVNVKFDIVVSSFISPPFWLLHLTFPVHAVVYRRQPKSITGGLKLPCGGEIEERELMPNHGREAAAYLHFMETQTEFADLTAFVHANAPNEWHSKSDQVYSRLENAYIGAALSKQKEQQMGAAHGREARLISWASRLIDLNNCPCPAPLTDREDIQFIAANQTDACRVFSAAAHCRECAVRPELDERCRNYNPPPLPSLSLPANFTPWLPVHFDDRKVQDIYDLSIGPIREILRKHGAFNNSKIGEKFGYAPCCAQFISQPWRLNLYSKALYRELKELVLNSKYPDQESGRLFEWSWRRLFHSAAMTKTEQLEYHEFNGIIM